jgi:hypothetical protein
VGAEYKHQLYGARLLVTGLVRSPSQWKRPGSSRLLFLIAVLDVSTAGLGLSLNLSRILCNALGRSGRLDDPPHHGWRHGFHSVAPRDLHQHTCRCLVSVQVLYRVRGLGAAGALRLSTSRGQWQRRDQAILLPHLFPPIPAADVPSSSVTAALPSPSGGICNHDAEGRRGSMLRLAPD